jgi:hypothetical protein
MQRVRVFFWLIVVLGSVAAGIVAVGQTKAGKVPRAEKTGKPTNSTFTCPDPLAAEACKYFEDLYAAHDKNVSRSLDATSLEYVCFREGSDQFFTVHLSGPPVFEGIQRDSQKQQPVRDATALGWGEITTFAHGVEDKSIAPQLHFKGTWVGFHYFVATEINRQGVSGSVVYSISVDPQQFNVAWRYKSPSAPAVDYRLVIQQSTGRFSETFAKNPSKLPSLVKEGRCSPLGMPKAEGTPPNH